MNSPYLNAARLRLADNPFGNSLGYRLLLACAAVLSVLIPRAAECALVINEFMASNVTTVADEAGEFEDWIEVLNTGPGPVTLTGMFLTDDVAVPQRWPIPSLVLGPNERALFWADGETVEGPLHANFRLEVNGEQVGLFDSIANGNGVIDSITFDEQAADASFGRFPDGTGAPIFMATPTPNAPNVDQGNVAPLVSDTGHFPASPASLQPVTVTSRLRDLDGSLPAGEQRLFFQALSTLMYDDGLHGDGAAGDQVWGAEIPGFAAGTTVHYYIRARDNEAAQTLDPAGAPGITYSYVVGYVPPPLFLNEFMAANTMTFADEFGQFDDWVEVYNAGSQPIDLGGLGLSDDLGVPDRYTFPSVILNAGDFLIVWCDNDVAQGPYHTSFALSAAGESLGLFASAADGHAVIDSLTFQVQTNDVSMARIPDGGPWQTDTTPTPDQSNGSQAVEPTTWGRIRHIFRR